MKINYQTITSPCLILLIATFSVAGCASTGLQRSEEVQTTMETVNNNINDAAKQLEATEASLEKLIKPGQTDDVKKAFTSFTENVSKLESVEEDFASHAEQMKTRGNNYFEEWEKEGEEYENPQIQQLSEQRRSNLENMYEEVTENSIKVSEAFDSYVQDIKEIQSYLSNDLTEKGIAAVAPTTKEVVSEGDSLKRAIRDVQSDIQKARTEMSHEGTGTR